MKKEGNGLERLRILEKAVENLGDVLRKRDDAYDEEFRDIVKELKALKMFLSRNIPEFKKQFPEIQQKVK